MRANPGLWDAIPLGLDLPMRRFLHASRRRLAPSSSIFRRLTTFPRRLIHGTSPTDELPSAGFGECRAVELVPEASAERQVALFQQIVNDIVELCSLLPNRQVFEFLIFTH